MSGMLATGVDLRPARSRPAAKERTMRMTQRLIGLALLLVTASAWGQPAPPPPTWRIKDAPAELRYAVSRGDLIVAALQDALRRELTEALEVGGPDFAIKACHIDVIGVTQRIGRDEGIAAGRTSDRLRVPTNAPRPWAAPLVAAHAGERARDVDGFVADLGDKVGLLRPIAQRPECASCHGPADRLSPAVREALRDRYPRDRALGFVEGEIRGWFWVEIPKPKR
jgi:hypothetical protein